MAFEREDVVMPVCCSEPGKLMEKSCEGHELVMKEQGIMAVPLSRTRTGRVCVPIERGGGGYV